VSGGRALNAIRRGRRTFVTLSLVCLGMAVGATFLGARAIEKAEAQAQITANGLANAGVASVLVPGDVTGAIGGDAARDLLARLQRGVLADGTAFRVRVWSPSGDLLFSTDAGDEPDAVSADLDSVYASTRGSGRIESVRSDDGQEFATFVPLRFGQDRSLGAVEVDQGYERIATSAASVWPLLRILGAAGGGLSLLLAAVTFLPGGSASRTGGFITPGRASTFAKQRAVTDEGIVRAADERARAAEQRATTAEERAAEIERGARDAEARERDAELRAVQAEAGLEVAHDEMGRLRTSAVSEAELAAAEQAAEEGNVRAENALQRAAAAEREVEQVTQLTAEVRALTASERSRIAEADTRVSELSARLAEADGRAEAAETRLAETTSQASEAAERIALLEVSLGTERAEKAELERAASSTSKDGAEERARASEAEARASRAEARASEAEGRTTEAELRATEAKSRATEAKSRATEAKSRLEAMASGGRNAEQLVSQLEGELLTASGSIAELEQAVEASRERLDRERSHTTDLEARLSEVGARASDAEARAQATGAELAEQQTLAHAEQGRGEALQLEIDALKASVTTATAEVVELEEALERTSKTARADLEAAHTSAKQDLDVARASAKQDLDAARASAKQDLDAARASAKQEVRASTGQVEAVKAEARERIETDRAEVRGRLADLEASLAEAEGRVQAADEKVAVARAQADRASVSAEAARTEAAAAAARAEEAERLTAVADETVRRSEVRVREAEAAAEKVRAKAEAATTRADDAQRSAAEKFEEADSKAADVEQAAHQLQVRVAEATASAQASKTEAAEATSRAEAAEARAETEIAAAIAQAQAATERARAEAVDAVRRATGSSNVPEATAGDASETEQITEFEGEIARLEEELGQMADRLRHAYAQSESARAMVSTARGAGLLPQEVAELHDLREQSEQLRRDHTEVVERLREAERRAAGLQVELLDARAIQSELHVPGTATDGDEGSDFRDGEGSRAAMSLRTRLAETASRKKGDKGDRGARSAR